MVLLLILLLPLGGGLLCIAIRSARLLEMINLIISVGLVLLAGVVGQQVLAEQAIGAFNGFLYADNLSALVVGLTAFVSLVSSIYAVGYFRRDLASGRITLTQSQRYYRLTPFFIFAMLLVALANNLGV